MSGQGFAETRHKKPGPRANYVLCAPLLLESTRRSGQKAEHGPETPVTYYLADGECCRVLVELMAVKMLNLGRSSLVTSSMNPRDTCLHLRNTRVSIKTLQGLAGFAFIVVILIIASALFRREWEALGLAVLPIGLLAGIEWLRRLTPEDHVILYPDRMALFDIGSRRSEVRWSDVVAIHWPKQRDGKIPIRIEVASERNESSRSVRVSLQEISRAIASR
jgi:hypothetical protein